jgi:hypothetical protein
MDDRAKSELIRAVRSILKPLVRQLIAHGVTFPAFNRLAKEVYIDVGTKHFALPFKKQTDSRVALVTGITRKEIGQIRRGQAMPLIDAAHLDYGLATRVVGRWVTDKRYVDADGNPRALPYEDVPPQPSFVSLVDEIGGDIPPRAVLDELIRVGAVSLSPQGRVNLLSRAYIPARGTEEKLAILGSDAAELIGAISHNIDNPSDEAFLQRKVYYDNIGSEALAELRRRVREVGGSFVQQVNELLASYDRDRNPQAPGGARKRTVVGVYYIEEDYEQAEVEPPPAEEEDEKPRKR